MVRLMTFDHMLCMCSFNSKDNMPFGLIAPPFTIGFLVTESLPKVKLGQVEVGSNIAQNHSSSLQKVISGHYLPQFI